MADTIKNLSDHAVAATIIIVGVAESVSDLIAEHESIDRALVQVRMPRMSKVELEEIIYKGIAEAQLSIDRDTVDKFVRLSHGLPHFSHLLGLESGAAAIARDSLKIEDKDFTRAVRTIVESKQTIASAYYKAVTSAHKASTHKMTLVSCALSPIDEHGFFLASGVSNTLGRLTHKPCKVSDIQRHLNEFVSATRGSIIERHGEIRRYRYRFANPLSQPYTIIHSLAEKLVTETQVWMMDQPYFG